MAFYQKHESQVVNGTLEEVWDFISSPVNLKKITPASMGFDITSKVLPEKMYPGLMIEYNVKPIARISTKWVTEITHVKDLSYFVDEQRIGPFKIWHHEHIISQLEDGKILMEDIISYSPPLGFLGSIANSIMIKKQLNKIFDYRREAIVKRFPKI